MPISIFSGFSLQKHHFIHGRKISRRGVKEHNTFIHVEFLLYILYCICDWSLDGKILKDT